MDKNYGMELVRATEISALTASHHYGRGNSELLLQKARAAITKSLSKIPFQGTVINDRYKDFNQQLAFPSQLGKGKELMDLMIIAVDGQKNVATGKGNTASFIAVGKKGSFAELPNIRMFKMITPEEVSDSLDIHDPIEVNIHRVARKLGKYIENTTVCIRDSHYNADLIEEVRKTGARITLIEEGDVSAAISTILNKNIDITLGISGALEGVLTAALVRCLNGNIQGKLIFQTESDFSLASKHGITDFQKIYQLEDLAKVNEIAIAATGISEGLFLKGVTFYPDGAETHSFVVRGETKTYRFLTTRHYFDYKPVF